MAALVHFRYVLVEEDLLCYLCRPCFLEHVFVPCLTPAY